MPAAASGRWRRQGPPRPLPAWRRWRGCWSPDRSAGPGSAPRSTNSRRAAAANVHITGDSIGAVGASPANGLKSAFTALANAVVTTSTGSCAAWPSTPSAAARRSSRSSREASPRERPRAVSWGSVTTEVSSAVCVGAVFGARTTRVLVAASGLRVDPATGSAVPLTGCESFVRFFWRCRLLSGSALSTLETFDASGVSA